MKLHGPLRRVFGFTDKDNSKPGTFISPPSKNGSNAFAVDCGKHQVTFIHQTHVNLCGDACVNMLFSFKGKAHGSLDKNPRGIFEGLSNDDIRKKLRAGGLVPVTNHPAKDKAYSAAELGGLLKRYGPIIVSRSRHSVLLTGIDGDRVFIHDPWRGPNMVMTVDAFNRSLEWGECPLIMCI